MSATSPPTRRTRILHWLLIMGAATLLVLTIKFVRIFFLSPEATDLHRALSHGSAWPTTPEMKFSIGPGLLAMGRVAAWCTDDLPIEARHALRAIDGASVGIYRLDRRLMPLDRGRMLAAADTRLGARGWVRVVTVMENRDLVLVYLPRKTDVSGRLEVCIAVVGEDKLVVVSAAAQTAALAKMVETYLPRSRSI